MQFGDKKIHRHMPPLVRKNMQMVFQDPYASLDPRMSIQRILEEPLRIHERMSAEEKKSRILPLLEQVGLSRDSLKKYPQIFRRTETEDCHCQSFGDGSAAFIV